jgi:hypothetical protein
MDCANIVTATVHRGVVTVPRYPHYLSHAKGDSHPGRIVGLACESAAVRIDGPGVRVAERLTRWCAAGWARDGDKESSEWEREGTDAESAWRAIDYALRRGGQTWVVSLGACRVWGLLGLWEMLEDGRVYIDGRKATRVTEQEGASAGTEYGIPDQRHAGHASSASVPGKGNAGIAVLEDPPTVLRLRRPGLPGTLFVTDIRNWGIEGPTDRQPAPVEVRWACGALVRLDRLLRERGWGSLCATAGAQAWRIWRHKYGDQPVYVHRNQDALDLEEAAYYGGRCECRYLGVYPEHVYHVDYRSMYLSICAGVVLPTLLCQVAEGQTDSGEGAAGSKSLRIATVSLRTDEPAYPYRRDSETYYPIGEYTTTLAGPELDDAIARGRVRSFKRIASYRGSAALSAQARSIWNALVECRDRGDSDLANALKRIGVSLPGRCGQRGYRWTPCVARPSDPIWGEWWRLEPDGELRHYRAIAGDVEAEIREQWAPESIPAIAAWVCSAGRMALLSAIRQAGWDNVLYYDTDSLIVNESGYQYLWLDRRIRHDEFGQLRHISRADRCEILGIKHYILDGVRTCAGLPKGEVMRGATPETYWYQRHARGQIYDGHRPAVERLLQTYARETGYHHGIPRADGWVDPLEVHQQ